MASAGQAIGAVIGAIIGSFTPVGPIIGAQIGMTIGGMLDPPKGPTIRGPRLSDLRVQTATYGVNIPRIYGTVATYGNVFWVENNQLRESVKKKKSGGKGGGGGSTIKTYSYSATFAVGLCKGPIAGVRRVWVGSKLIYDAGAADIESIIASNRAATSFAIYTGSTTQMPDPRMQAAIGATNCPAYRGLAYIVLYDFPLADHGNSLLGAQVKVEVVSVATGEGFRMISQHDATSPFSASASLYAMSYRYHEPLLYYTVPQNDSRLTSGLVAVDTYNVLTDTVTRINSGLSVLDSNWGNGSGKSDTEYFGTKDYNPGVVSTSIGGAIEDTLNSFGQYYAIRNGEYYTIRADGSMRAYTVGPVITLARTYTGPFTPNIATSSYQWAVGVTDDHVYFGVVNSTPSHVILKFEISGNFVAQVSAPSGLAAMSVHADDEIYFPIGTSLYVTRDFFATTELIGTQDRISNPAIGDFSWNVFVPAPNVYLVCSSSPQGAGSGVMRITLYTDAPTISGETVLLSEIVQAECLQSNVLTAGDLDVTALTQQVRGYRVTQTGAIRGALEPLQAAWPFDVVQSGYELKFVPRGGSSVATIPATDLDARQDSEAPGVQLTISHEMDTQLPREVRVKYLDVTREYDDGDQPATRQNTDSIHIRDVELPIVLNAVEAAGMAEVLLYLYWLERRDVQFKLPPSYRALEPADVITITGEWGEYSLRLTGVHLLSDGRLECSAKYNAPAIYTPTAVGAEGESTGQVIALDGPSLYALLDVPLMRDEDDMPGFPAAMSGYTTGWPGGIIFQSPDDGQTWEDVQGFTGPVPIGYARDTIGAGRTDIIDTANRLQVGMVAGELESVSQLTMFAGANHFAYGAHGRWEIIGAANCVLQGDGSYILSDFLRGRFGTEQYMTTHVAGDQLVLLTDGDMGFVAVQSSSIGSARSYRGITAGRTIDDDADRSFTYSGVNLECLSPVYLNGNRHPTTNDWTLTAIRRGRVSPAWRDLVDVPLGEASESYEWDIFSDGTYTTLKRTLASSTLTVGYASALQVTDFGSNQSTLHLKIYQLSASVGRGYPLTTSITR
jgi:hypothetical protein